MFMHCNFFFSTRSFWLNEKIYSAFACMCVWNDIFVAHVVLVEGKFQKKKKNREKP